MTDTSVADPVAEPIEAPAPPPQADAPRETLSMHKALLIAGLAVATTSALMIVTQWVNWGASREA